MSLYLITYTPCVESSDNTNPPIRSLALLDVLKCSRNSGVCLYIPDQMLSGTRIWYPLSTWYLILNGKLRSWSDVVHIEKECQNSSIHDMFLDIVGRLKIPRKERTMIKSVLCSAPVDQLVPEKGLKMSALLAVIQKHPDLKTRIQEIVSCTDYSEAQKMALIEHIVRDAT